MWGRNGETTHKVSKRPGGQMVPGKHGAREKESARDIAGSRMNTPRVTCPSPAPSVWWPRLLDIMPGLHPHEKMKISHQPPKLDHFISGFA